MTSGGFGTDTTAIARTASAFDAQVDPIMQQALRLESIKGTSSTTGRDYGAQGSQYHDAVTGSLEKLVRTYSEKTEWLSANLGATGSSYGQTDSANAQGLSSAGSE